MTGGSPGPSYTPSSHLCPHPNLEAAEAKAASVSGRRLQKSSVVAALGSEDFLSSSDLFND